MNANPLVSIIIPTYNRAHLIVETLDSVLVQTYTHWECIIVDDGSTDDTAKVVGEYVKMDARFQYHERPKDRLSGGNAARNYGFEISRGEYVNWFDSDDLMHPKKLELQVSALLNSSSEFVVCQTLMFKREIDNLYGLRKSKIHSGDFFNDFVCNNIKWLTQAPLISSLFLKSKKLKFNERIFKSQEREFFIDLLAQVINYEFINEPLVYQRVHSNTISNGMLSEKKIISVIEVDSYILTSYYYLLSEVSRQYLQKQLKKSVFELSKMNIHKGFWTIKCIQSNFSFREKLNLYLGSLLVFMTGKGERFFR